MNKRRGLNLILALIVAAGAFVCLRQQLHWRAGAQAAEKAAQMARVSPSAPEPLAETPLPAEPSPDPAARELAGLDLPALQAVNGDVAAWLLIPDTEISHPIVRGTDNRYYLRHTWEGKWNGGGAIFLDCRCSRDFGDFHSVLYGHRMNNGSMFAPLHQYAEEDYWRQHPNVYVADGQQVRRYEIFAVWEPPVDSPVYTLDQTEPEEKQVLLELCLAESWYDTGVIPGPEDQILTLSTCTTRGHESRWVVHARLAAVYEGA